jgi:hypothetical protein
MDWIIILVGTCMILINLLWLFFWGKLFYEYHFTKILFVYMYPDWIVITNLTIGLIGLLIGVRLIKNRVIIWKAILFDILILLIGTLLAI